MSRFDIVTIGGAVKDFTFYTDQGRLFNTPENLTAQKMLGHQRSLLWSRRWSRQYRCFPGSFGL
jgi:hypothetical protein